MARRRVRFTNDEAMLIRRVMDAAAHAKGLDEKTKGELASRFDAVASGKDTVSELALQNRELTDASYELWYWLERKCRHNPSESRKEAREFAVMMSLFAWANLVRTGKFQACSGCDGDACKT